MKSIVQFLTSNLLWTVKSKDVGEGPADELYQAYTTEFDLEVDAINIPRVIPTASPDKCKGWLELGDFQWKAAISKAEEIYSHMLGQASDVSSSWRDSVGGANLSGHSISILIDQSGSMKGEPIAQAAAASKLLLKILGECGARTELLGFSTAGWHGGFARKLWASQGRPSRPGRLCSLLHIIYKSPDEKMLDEKRWQAMLNPDILRENVDGEAILWAANRLKLHPEKQKILIVISDGAPVDDSTLSENGPSYLEKHLRHVIQTIEDSSYITLAAVGIGYAVDRYYGRSVFTKDITNLPAAMAEILRKVVD